MIAGTGIDIIEIKRFEKMNPHFTNRCYTEREQAYLARSGPQAKAGLFAAKEAVVKALGTGFRGFWPNEVEILHDGQGKPYAELHGKARRIAEDQQAVNLQISVSHNETTATAIALLEKYPDTPSPKPEMNLAMNPEREIKPCGHAITCLTDADIPDLLPKRPMHSHKYTFGRVCVLAGCRDMPGAAVLCCRSAYTVGAGLVDACVTEEVARVIHGHIPEAITTIRTEGVSETLVQSLSKATVTALGPGLGGDFKAAELVRYTLSNACCPVVLDADGLNHAAGDLSMLKQMSAPCVVTPHAGEMSRLTGKTVADIRENPIETAMAFAREYGTITLLKGARTVIAHPEGQVFVNTTGNASMAKAGSGDTLTGIVAGLIAQGTEVFMAAALGAYLHGKAGESASAALSLYSVNASDLINALPGVLRYFV